jgi:CDP-4-dehydro-6-deoxyglucose reductase
MSAQVTIQPSGHEFFVEGNDTLLEAALRAGIPLNYGCSNGNCGDCKARLVSGQVEKGAPARFRVERSGQGPTALFCCAPTPRLPMWVIEATVSGAEDIPEQGIVTKVKAVEKLGEDIAALHLTAPRSQRLRFLAGQHVHAIHRQCRGRILRCQLPVRGTATSRCMCGVTTAPSHARCSMICARKKRCTWKARMAISS